MRIITGFARGCRLETLPGQETRPTADRVKEGLFSALQFELEGKMVLDLFAGSGQLGAEAVSRGAAGCVFVDSSAEAAAAVRRNVDRLRQCAPPDKQAALGRHIHIHTMEARRYIQMTSDRYDIALLDPPYKAGLLPELLPEVAGRMNPGGIIVCETDAKTSLPAEAANFRKSRAPKYGKTVLHIYRWEKPAV